jgi:hypothetical protein
MTTPYASQEIRDAYGLFWRKKSGKRLPNDLKGISFSNSTTFSTRVRLRLLKELCRRHQAANPDLSCYVTSYMARPELRIRERRGMVTSLTYTKAIQQLSHHLTISFLQELYKYAKTNLPEKEIAERFLILTPDLLLGSAPEAQPQPMVVDDPTSSQQPTPNQVGAPSQPVAQHVTTGGLPLSEITYASLAALPPSSSGASFTLFNSTSAVPTPSQPGASTLFLTQTPPTIAHMPTSAQVSTTSPTYATLTPVPISPPNLSTGSFLNTAPSSGQGTPGDDFSLVQRQRHRFAQKSTPYPQPS